MSDVIAQEDYKGYRIEIVIDHDAENPRKDFDNPSTMYCLHGKYNLGDEHNYSNPNELLNAMLQSADPDTPETDEMRPEDLPHTFPIVYLPLYLYDHSGITMSTRPFSCPWDSGQVGYIFITHEDAQKHYGIDPESEDFKKEVEDRLRFEVSIYDCYLRGEVCGFRIFEDDEAEDEVDSCYGFYGEDYCLQNAKESVDVLQAAD